MSRPSHLNGGKSRLWILLVCSWISLVALGTARLELFAATPGSSASGESTSAGRRFHLYVFFHPLCECSVASVAELHRLVEHVDGRLDVTAVIDLAGLNPDKGASLKRRLGDAHGIAVETDPDGTKTASFGAKTSGQALLYDPQGNLVFSGGITAARAHEGDNDGEAAIIDIVNRKKVKTRSTPVFGCALSSPEVRR